MTQQTDTPRIPTLTLGWRLKMALGEMDAQKMAELLGVHRGTVSRWISDHGAPPKRAYVAQWSLITNTDRDWLETGKAPGSVGPGGEELPRLDSNQEPSDSQSNKVGRLPKRVAAEFLGNEAA